MQHGEKHTLPESLGRIPLLDEEKAALIRDNYFFPIQGKISRRESIQLTAQALFDKGARMINQYADNGQSTLLEEYHRLRQLNLTMQLGAMKIRDPISAALVLRTTLDNLRPEQIPEIYYFLFLNVGHLANDVFVTFPDKSQLPLVALFDLINSYIINNNARFHIDLDNLKSYEAFWQHRYIIGTDSPKNKNYDTLLQEFQKLISGKIDDFAKKESKESISIIQEKAESALLRKEKEEEKDEFTWVEKQENPAIINKQEIKQKTTQKIKPKKSGIQFGNITIFRFSTGPSSKEEKKTSSHLTKKSSKNK